MKKILMFITGSFIAVMILFNSKLAGKVGNTLALFIIHFLGFITISGSSYLAKNNLKIKAKLPVYSYIGGLLGVLIVVCNVKTVVKIGVANTIILGLVGQIFFSVLIDSLGVFKREKKKLTSQKIFGVFLVFIGAVLTIY